MDNRPGIASYGFEDSSWENYGFCGYLSGFFLAAFGICLQVIEIVRIHNGLYNYGLKNFDMSDQNQFGLINTTNSNFLYGEPWHFWPWTYPGNFIGLLVLITGIVGIISGCRKSYTILYSYYALLVLSILMPIFLIVYYSIMIAYYQKFSTNKQPSAEMWNVNNRPDTGDQSYALVASNLALSCATFALSLVTVFFVCSAGKIGLRLKDYVDIYGNPKPPSYGYVNY